MRNLSLGPSNDDSEQVRIEIRAAEIAADGGPNTESANFEAYGWLLHQAGGPVLWTNQHEAAGYLARCITTHEDV